MLQREGRLDRRVVGEPDRRARPRRPRGRSAGQAAGGGSTTSSPRDEQVVERRPRPVGGAQPELALERVEDVPALARAQVEVAAEDQRRAAGPVDAADAAARTSSSAARAAPARRSRAGWRSQTSAPSRGRAVNAIIRRSGRGPAVSSSSRRSSDPRREPGSGSSRPRWRRSGRGSQSAISRARARPNELREVSARCASAAGRPRERLGPARRALLQQGDVPVGRGQQDARELVAEVAVDLHVGGVALGDPQQPRAPRAAAPDRAGGRGRGRGSSSGTRSWPRGP